MEKDDQYEEALTRLASDSDRWLRIREVLEQQIRSNLDLIEVIDARVKSNEIKLTKLQ